MGGGCLLFGGNFATNEIQDWIHRTQNKYLVYLHIKSSIQHKPVQALRSYQLKETLMVSFFGIVKKNVFKNLMIMMIII